MKLLEIDHLEIQVLVDNVTDNLSSVPPGVTHEIPQLRKMGMKELSGECLCCGAHGLSLLLKAEKAGQSHSLLFDAGPEGEVFKRNVSKLQANLGQVEDIVLSHGHWDHAGGFLTALELIQAQNPGQRPRMHLNPGMFHQRATRIASGEFCPFKKVPSAQAFEDKGAEVVNSEQARVLQDGFFYLSGEIPRVTAYEKGYPEHCRQTPEGEWVPDPLILDERFLAVHVRGKGLIIFSACSHAGIVNVISAAQKLFPQIPIYAVMGGFHLSGASMEPIISQTVKDMEKFNLQQIIPAHCTGWRAVSALGQVFGDQVVVPSAVGRRYIF